MLWFLTAILNMCTVTVWGSSLHVRRVNIIKYSLHFTKGLLHFMRTLLHCITLLQGSPRLRSGCERLYRECVWSGLTADKNPSFHGLATPRCGRRPALVRASVPNHQVHQHQLFSRLARHVIAVFNPEFTENIHRGGSTFFTRGPIEEAKCRC